MNDKSNLQRKLEELGRAVAPRRTVVDVVMDRIEQGQVTSPRAQPIRRIIMKSRLIKIAACLIIVVGIVGLFTVFSGGDGITSMAFADVAENVCEAKTLTFLVRDNEQEPAIMKFMVIHPHLSRWELLGGRTLADLTPKMKLPEASILIVDTRKRKTIMLNPEKGTAIETEFSGEMLGIYDAFRNFRHFQDYTITELGERRIGDRQTVGFKLEKEEGHEIVVVWADPETKLPILLEGTMEDREGQIKHSVCTDIVFDVPLDESLFSVEAPPDYQIDRVLVNQIDLANRVKAATNMNRILKACREYVREHNGHWPDSLGDLVKYGIDEETLANPRLPGRRIGYIYVKAPVSPPESRIVLYEASSAELNGINVGLANYQVQLIKDEADFENRLKHQGR